MRARRFVNLVAATIALAMSLNAQSIDWDQVHASATRAEKGGSLVERPVPRPTSKVQTAYEDYYVSSLDHRRRTFAWQAFAGKVIFWMVLGLVMSGMVFSAIQFYFVIRRGAGDIPEELELSIEAVKIRSQFLGVVTLALSLTFFYLYLKNVYPIVRVEPTTIEQKR